MNIESLHQFVAFNTTIGDKQTVTFGDDNKQKLVGLNGSPRELGDAAKLELDQNTILLKSRILTAVRDAVGDDQSAVFRNIETMLFGKLDKRGQFVEKNAAKPLTMRDLKKVVDTLAKANVAQSLTLVKAKGPEIEEVVVPRLQKKNLTDAKTLSKAFDQALRNIPGGDPVYGNTADLKMGYGSVSPYMAGVPEQFGKDFCRTHKLILPGVGNVSYMGKDEKQSIEEAADKVTRSVTKGRFQHFKDLTGDDLKRVQFAMSLMNQSTINSVAMGAPFALFGVNADGESQGAVIVNGKPVYLSYEVNVDDDGGLTIICRAKLAVNEVESFADPADPDLPYGLVDLRGTSSSIESTISFHYSADKLKQIFDSDWTGMTQADRESLVVADERTFDLSFNLVS